MPYYFAPTLDEERCYTKDTIKDMMRSSGIDEVEVFKAKRLIGEGFYYCTHFGEAGDSGDGFCGMTCKEYTPRNRKNGRCRHSGYCYEPTEFKEQLKTR